MKKRMLLIAGFSLVLGAVLFSACKKEPKNTDSTDTGYDRKAMLTNYADNYIIPAYADMATKLAELQASVDQFTANPDLANLASARLTFVNAYTVWQKTDMLEFGPGEDVSLRMYMNTYPVTVSKVSANMASGNYDLEQFGNKDAQGFPAVDYLLNGGTDNAATLAWYTDAQAAQRKKYLKDVVAKMVQKVTEVKDSWGVYRNEFVNNTGTDAGSSTSKMVNAFVLYYERYLRSGKIGLPVGAMTGTAKPEIAEAYYTPELGKTLALTALQSVKKFYEGKHYNVTQQGQGMYAYLAAVGTKDDDGQLMADVISTALANATSAVQGLNTTIVNGVQSERPAVLAIYDKLQLAVPLLKVDMVSAFGISITYVDNDGD